MLILRSSLVTLLIALATLGALPGNLRISSSGHSEGVGTAARAGAIEDARTDANCTAYTVALIERAQAIARTVLISNAFRQCIERRMVNYRPCGSHDAPSLGQPVGRQIEKVYQALGNHNHIRYSCSYDTSPNTGASAHIGTWGGHDHKTMDLADDWAQSFGDWSTYDRAKGQPFNYRASDIIHEYLHTHGYEHPNDPACASPGVERSAPYIIGDCADNVVEESGVACNLFGAGPDALTLISGLREFAGGARSCETARDPANMVALRTFNGKYLSPANGGGGSLDAHAIGHGRWETLSIIPLGERTSRISILEGRPLRSGDTVRIKTGTGHYLGLRGDRITADFAGTLGSAPAFTIYKQGAAIGAAVQNGDPISLRVSPGSRFVTAENGGGSAVVANRDRAAEWETFIYEKPRRAHVVRLNAGSTSNPIYVAAASILADGRHTALPGRGDEASAFWIVDHNGGRLNSGDTVSIETLRSQRFLTRCSTGSDMIAAIADTMQACSKFVLEKVGGSGPINRGDIIAFRTTEGKYLTAVPDRRGELANYTRSLGPWERFVFLPVQGDRWAD